MQSKAKSSGWWVIIFLYLIVSLLLIYSFSIISLRYGYILNFWPVYNYQYKEYFGDNRLPGIRSIWQSLPECAEADRYLVYKPRNGTCRFINPEFDTKLTFNTLGRVSPAKFMDDSIGKGIAVIGDSFAMGWGVDDDAVFSVKLQEIVQRPVYNLAVSSYGTRRELRRLVKANILTKVDTIIIQYCENDLSENTAVLSDVDYEVMSKKFSNSIQFSRKNLNGIINFKILAHRIFIMFVEPLRPAINLLNKVVVNHSLPNKGIDFKPHYNMLMSVLDEYKAELESKRVIIIYANHLGEKFYNFPNGKDVLRENIIFKEIKTEVRDYYSLDGHLNNRGHHTVAEALSKLF